MSRKSVGVVVFISGLALLLWALAVSFGRMLYAMVLTGRWEWAFLLAGAVAVVIGFILLRSTR